MKEAEEKGIASSELVRVVGARESVPYELLRVANPPFE